MLRRATAHLSEVHHCTPAAGNDELVTDRLHNTDTHTCTHLCPNSAPYLCLKDQW